MKLRPMKLRPMKLRPMTLSTMKLSTTPTTSATTSVIRQRGFTIIELLIVLVVMAVLLSTTVALSSKSDIAASVSQDTSLVETVVRCAKRYRAGRSSYIGFDTESIIATHCIDGLGYINDDRDAIINPFGGTLSIEADEYNGIDDQGLVITGNGYSRDECSLIANSRINSARIVSINGNIVKNITDESVALSDITDECDADNNTIASTYTR